MILRYLIFKNGKKDEHFKFIPYAEIFKNKSEVSIFKILNDRERKVLQDFIKWDNNLTEKDLSSEERK